MSAIKILRLRPGRSGGAVGGGFIENLGRAVRPFLRNFAKNAGPMVTKQIENVGARAIRDGADLLTSSVLAKVPHGRKRKRTGGSKGGSGRKKRKRKEKAGGGLKRKKKKSKKQTKIGGKRKRNANNIKRGARKKSIITGGAFCKKKHSGKKKIGGKRKKKKGKNKASFSIFS